MPFAPLANHKDWEKHLLDQEILIWEGRPSWRFQVDPTAFVMVLPFFVVAITYMVLFRTVPERFDALLVAAIGLGTVYCLFYVAIRSTSSPLFARFALTDKRMILVERFPKRRIVAKHLTAATPLEWSGTDPGCVFFADEDVSYGMAPGHGLLNAFVVRNRKVGFRHIKEAERVYKRALEISKVGT